jgi:hypothetical protein
MILIFFKFCTQLIINSMEDLMVSHFYLQSFKIYFNVIMLKIILYTLPCRHPKSKIYVHHLKIQTCTTCGKKKIRTFGWTTIKDFRNLLYNSTQYGMMSTTIVFEFTFIWFDIQIVITSTNVYAFILKYLNWIQS